MFQHTIFAKKIRLSRTVFFVDFDGTLFTPDKRIFSAHFYNRHLTQMLNKHNIPFVVVTGRSHWNLKSDIETMLLGMEKPDAIVAGAGSVIYYRLANNQLAVDTSWTKIMKQTRVKWQGVEELAWNREVILQMLHCILPDYVTILPHSADTFLIRLYVRELPMPQLLSLKKKIEDHFTHGVQVIFTEKLLQKNSLEFFSGNILIVPTTAGKDNAVKYLLNIGKEMRQTPLNAYCFGDATIDVPMLSIKPQLRKYDIQTYGVNLTPLARKLLSEQIKDNPQMHIVDSPASPEAILNVAKELSLSLRKRVRVRDNVIRLSPAQNNPARILLQPFETALDSIFDQNLSADQISFKGLDMVKQSVDLLHHSHQLFKHFSIWKLYVAGNLTDIFDGIRARQTNTMSDKGQLIDVFCDRAKEFYQLYQRGLSVIARSGATRQSQEQGYQTLLAAISCILPSIARAQAELSGTVVKEKDPKGGSMISRTRRLFFSFFFESINLDQASFYIDQEIYNTNIATYQNRLKNIPATFSPLLTGEGQGEVLRGNQTPLQQKAHTRFLLLVQLLQEENNLVEKTLKPYPVLLKKYEKDFKRYIEKYLKIDVEHGRKKFHTEAYKNLNLYTYLTRG